MRCLKTGCKRAIKSALLSVVSIILTLFLTTTNLIQDGELWYQKVVVYLANFPLTSDVVNYLLSPSKEIKKDKFMFIDVDYSVTLMDKTEIDTAFGDKTVIGKQIFTDRKQLKRILDTLNKYGNYKYILCDVFFADSTEKAVDDSLGAALRRTKRIVIPYHSDKENIFPDVNKGLNEYEQIGDGFTKFKFVGEKNKKTIPLVMYENIHQKKLNTNGIFYQLDDDIRFLNNYILNFYVYSAEDSVNDYFYAEQFFDTLYIQNNEYKKRLQDRIVVIGGLKDRDMHKASGINMSGALILLNAYLNLRYSDNFLSGLFLLILFACYFLICYHFVIPCSVTLTNQSKDKTKVTGTSLKAKFLDFVVDFFYESIGMYILLLFFISIFSFLVSKIQINFVLLGFWFYGWDKLCMYFCKNKNESKEGKKIKLIFTILITFLKKIFNFAQKVFWKNKIIFL